MLSLSFAYFFCSFVHVLFLGGFIFLDYFTLDQRTIANINLTLYIWYGSLNKSRVLLFICVFTEAWTKECHIWLEKLLLNSKDKTQENCVVCKVSRKIWNFRYFSHLSQALCLQVKTSTWISTLSHVENVVFPWWVCNMNLPAEDPYLGKCILDISAKLLLSQYHKALLNWLKCL